MLMKPPLRKFVLTAHVTTTVGWLGAAVAYVVLVITLLGSKDVQTVRAAYLFMRPLVLFVILPLSLVALLTGIVQALGTSWGLFRHWWVVVKLGLAVVSVSVLLEYVLSSNRLAGIAAGASISAADLDLLRSSELVLQPAGGLLVLLTAEVLGIYKPRGMTRYGRRKVRGTVAAGVQVR
jgi:hypothetical protein